MSADLLGCICLIGSSHCERNCVKTLQQNRIDLRHTKHYKHQVPLIHPSQPIDQAIFQYVEDQIDSDHEEIVKLEAWSDGTLKVWVRSVE